MRKPTTGFMMSLGALFMCAPFALNASAPRNSASLSTSARVTQAKVGKIRVAARLDRGAHNQLRVQLTAVNPTDQPAVARVRVDVFERNRMSRFARMPPPPIRHGNASLEIRLKPHERLVKVVPVTRRGKPVKLAKRSMRRSWLSVRPAPHLRRAKRAVHAQRAPRAHRAVRAQRVVSPRPHVVAAAH